MLGPGHLCGSSWRLRGWAREPAGVAVRTDSWKTLAGSDADVARRLEGVFGAGMALQDVADLGAVDE